MQDVRAHVESVVSAKMVEVEGRLSKTLSGCAKKASVRDESDALKVLLAGVVMRLREEHTALVEAINAQEAMTNAPTVLLGALCGQVKAMNEKNDSLCSHGSSCAHRRGRCINRQLCSRHCQRDGHCFILHLGSERTT